MNEGQNYGIQPNQGYPPNQGYTPQNQYNNSYPPPSQYGNTYQQQQQNYQQPQYPPTNFKDEEKFKPVPKYRDLWAFLLYLCFLMAFILLSVFLLKDFKLKNTNTNKENGFATKENFIAFAIAGGVSLVLSLLYVLLMQVIPTLLIHVSFWFSIALYVLATIYYFIEQQYLLGILFAILTVVHVFLYFNWRSRIPFASLMLENVAKFTKHYYGTIILGLFFLILDLGFIVYWTFTLLGAIDKYSTNCDDRGRCTMSKSLYGIYVFMAFVLFWTSQLFKDIVHMSIVGSFGSYYFFSTNSRFTTLSSFKRSMTTSIGSACFGSLLVSLIRFVKFLIQQLSSQSNNVALEFLACCLQCILSQIEHLLEYFNMYAYTYCAMYGKPYLEAGKATWNLIKDRGVEAIINDSLISNVIAMGSILISVVAAFLAYLYMISSTPLDNQYTSIVVIVSFVLAMLLNSIVSQVIESANIAFFVCLAEDPQVLTQTNPRLFEKIKQTYPQIATSV